MADKKKNMWAASANPDERKRIAKQREKTRNEKEMRTTNVVRQTAWDRLTGKPGEMKKR